MADIQSWGPEAKALLKDALSRPGDVERFFQNPTGFAAGRGHRLDQAFAQQIQDLGESAKNDGALRVSDREVREFFQRVVTDGRYLNDWAQNPRDVAQRLNVDLSPDGERAIADIRSQVENPRFLPGVQPQANVAVVAVAIA